MERGRSRSVTIFGSLFCIAGAIPLLIFLFAGVFYFHLNIDEYIVNMGDSALMLYRLISGVSQIFFIILLAVMMLISGIGSFFLKPWSRKMALYVISPVLILSFPFIGYDIIEIEWALINDSIMILIDPVHMRITVITFVVNIGAASAIIYFLARPEIKKQFRK